jgi:hypothetical protein
MQKQITKITFCELSKVLVKENIDSYLYQVSNPKFICQKCFRVSKNKENLCHPKKTKKFI